MGVVRIKIGWAAPYFDGSGIHIFSECGYQPLLEPQNVASRNRKKIKKIECSIRMLIVDPRLMPL